MSVFNFDRIAERLFDGLEHPPQRHFMIENTAIFDAVALCVLRDPKWCLAGTVYRPLKLSPKITCPACITFFRDNRRVIGEELR
jgi:hypothetical protein